MLVVEIVDNKWVEVYEEKHFSPSTTPDPEKHNKAYYNKDDDAIYVTATRKINVEDGTEHLNGHGLDDCFTVCDLHFLIRMK